MGGTLNLKQFKHDMTASDPGGIAAVFRTNYQRPIPISSSQL
jgi:hypothetical protein